MELPTAFQSANLAMMKLRINTNQTKQSPIKNLKHALLLRTVNQNESQSNSIGII